MADRSIGSTETAGTGGGATEQHELAGQDAAAAGSFDLRRIVSSTRSGKAAGPPVMPAASGQLTLAAFEGGSLLEPSNIVFVERGGPTGPVSLAGAEQDGAGNSGAFAIFASNASGASGVAVAALAGARTLGAMTSGAGMTSGPGGGGGGGLQPESLHLLQASGSLADAGSATGGVPGFGGYNVTLTVTPLPPAILAFLSGLAALFAFRRARGKAGEPVMR